MAPLKPTDVLSLTLTSKHLPRSGEGVTKEHQSTPANQLLRHHCDPAVFQMVVAHHVVKVAERKSSKPDPLPGSDSRKFRGFCSLYLRPTDKEVSLPEKSLDFRRVLDEWVNPPADQSFAQRALYIISIIYHILHSQPDPDPTDIEAFAIFRRFLSMLDNLEVWDVEKTSNGVPARTYTPTKKVLPLQWSMASTLATPSSPEWAREKDESRYRDLIQNDPGLRASF
ncbi:hypothetical protein DL771_006501 [Monosporascus sp. 5C6A]|nr:hypothetical protein DL771_006501 [Monosporascus sp. 5C6A]